MPSLNPPVCDFGWKAPGFSLPATDGATYSLSDVASPKGTLVMFICNHCPYVLVALDRILRDARELQGLGIGVAAICSNDATAYPDDSFENMGRMARERGFPFPYLHDASQDVARAWGAVCTPDFFGLNAEGRLQYRGRLDAAGRNPDITDAPRELFEAMRQIAETGAGPLEQVASIGCSIKWREA
ncbi:thioredoxin family protein [Roseibaca sp. Y0-43]|uniref:thioredoxin family protein n=1 Tax=Roseibaca sp. Y0-43 TaxID=2816854 RepID=UPI001D0CA7A2|nr:thioredoxin family protein [Roseibaca sp. Y0-43]MCC1481853.1 thioredoxin family protein [Roseibaca sp. Y0-43]